MIRNVVMGRLRDTDEADREAAYSDKLDEALAAIAALRRPGMLDMRIGRDAALREGGWSFAITNDWVDEAAYRAYDADEEHNRIRRELFAPICEEIARVQFSVPD
jgi:hypothetical protein